jgi:hypothetical protein
MPVSTLTNFTTLPSTLRAEEPSLPVSTAESGSATFSVGAHDDLGAAIHAGAGLAAVVDEDMDEAEARQRIDGRRNEAHRAGQLLAAARKRNRRLLAGLDLDDVVLADFGNELDLVVADDGEERFAGAGRNGADLGGLGGNGAVDRCLDIGAGELQVGVGDLAVE